MGIKKELGKKIKRMRQKRGLTQEQLAEIVDISQRTLSGIEIGENFVTAETFDKIVKALNTSSNEMFFSNHLKDTDELLKEIHSDIEKLKFNPLIIEIVYKFIKSLLIE